MTRPPSSRRTSTASIRARYSRSTARICRPWTVSSSRSLRRWVVYARLPPESRRSTEMDEHPDAAAFRKAMAEPQNPQDMMDSLDDNVEWHEIGSAEPLRGKEAVVKRGTSGDLGNYQIESKLHDVVANDDHTIALMENTV